MPPNKDNVKNNFEEDVKSLGKVLSGYSILDIAFSLLITSLWLPNIASGIKQLLLYSIFLSIDPSMFSNDDHIKSYGDFRQFLKLIINFLPEFPWIDDYVPEPDWGDVKFHHDDWDYRIFYGCEIENIYDYLMVLQFLYSSRDKDYINFEARSPDQELQECISLQDKIITGITTQPQSDKLDIHPGNFKIPPKTYWKQSLEFFQAFIPENIVSKNFIDRFACNPGSVTRDVLSKDKFSYLAFEGSLLPYYFLKFNNHSIPILPRRYSSIFIEEWAKLYRKHQRKLNEEDSYTRHLSTQIYRFIKIRLSGESLLPFVSAVTEDEQPHEIVFSCSFVSKEKLILIYTPAPFSSGEEFSQRLSVIGPKLKRAQELISLPPITLGLRGQGEIVKYESKNSNEILKPELFIICSQTSTEMQPVPLSEEPPGRLIFLDQFLGLFDEIEKPEEVSEFLKYLEEIEPKLSGLSFGLLDKYGSFKDSAGTLVGGANEPTMIVLDPHWGSNRRFKTLSEFWKQYPKNGYFDHPRSWRIESISDEDVRLTARSYVGSAIYCELTSSCLFTTAPFNKMSYFQGLVSDLLMQTLEDIIHRNKDLFEGLNIFHDYEQIQVTFFPWSLVKSDKDLKHLESFDPSGNKWISDVGYVKTGVIGVRVVFNEEAVGDAFEKSKDNSIEIDLLIEVLARLDDFAPDPKFVDIKEKLENLKGNKPRFMMFTVQKDVSFPEFISPRIPSSHYQKEATKKVAQFCKDSGFLPGEYELEEAETKLNTLRERLVELINSEVKKYDFEKSIPYLIEKTDALVFDYEKEIMHIEYSLEHEVDYQREENYAKKHEKFLAYHRTYRYLIEKFVQFRPIGKSTFDSDVFQYLAAVANQLLDIYSNSDTIHYGIYQAGMNVDDDFVMEVKHNVDLAAMQQSYNEDEAKIRLGILGKRIDRVDSSRKVEEFIEKLNNAFISDLGFGIKTMVNVLQILSQWPGYVEGVKEHTWYVATENQITVVCMKNIKGINKSEIPLILDFLTLKKADVVKLVGRAKPEPDIPVWEYRKRFARYNLRPIIRIKGDYLWGPYSALKSSTLWAQTPTNGQLPFDMGSSSIQRVVNEEKRLVEIALVDKTEEILKRYTMLVEKNLDLHKRDKDVNHPTSLGDYDILAYYPEKNTILNIEDKDLLPPFCPKDAKRLREKIFGKSKENDSYLGKVEWREEYLMINSRKISQFLRWEIDPNDPPRVVSLFVSRYAYWWTKFPPRSTKIKFLRVDMLDEFIKALGN